MKFKVELHGGKEISDLLKRVPKEKEAEVRAEVGTVALKIQAKAINNVRTQKATDTGQLLKVLAEFSPPPRIETEIGVVAPYAIYVEFSTRPHWPPPEPLEAWARHHGDIPVFLVQRSVAQRGMPARPFLGPAYDDHADELIGRIERVLGKKWE